MGKRFTDTQKWDREWFQELTPRMKCMWQFLCDECDHAGFWIENYRLATFKVNCPSEPFSRDEVERTFGARIRRISEDRIFIPGFLPFQIKKLNTKVRAHESALELLTMHGVSLDSLPWPKGSLTLTEGLPKGERQRQGHLQGGLGGIAASSVENSDAARSGWTDPPAPWTPPRTA